MTIKLSVLLGFSNIVLNLTIDVMINSFIFVETNFHGLLIKYISLHIRFRASESKCTVLVRKEKNERKAREKENLGNLQLQKLYSHKKVKSRPK